MAMTLTRWDPFRELAGMRSALDRVFDSGFRFPVFRHGEDVGNTTLGIDVFETNDEYVVKAAVPGVDPKDIEIQVEDDVLSITGEFHKDEKVEEGNWLRREMRYGGFRRSLRLPPTVDPQQATATFEHGVLKLALPKKAARARTIKITPQAVIENGATESKQAPGLHHTQEPALGPALYVVLRNLANVAGVSSSRPTWPWRGTHAQAPVGLHVDPGRGAAVAVRGGLRRRR